MQLCKALWTSRDFLATLTVNLIITLLINGLIDYFVIKNALLGASATKTFRAFEPAAFFIFFFLNIALLLLGTRNRLIKLIQGGNLQPFSRTLYNENVFVRNVLYSLREPIPVKRDVHFVLNIGALGTALYFALRAVIQAVPAINKHFVFTQDSCLTCAVTTELLWKTATFVGVYSAVYAAGMCRAQVGVRTTEVGKN